MYPTQINDEASLMACLDRMYKDYVHHCNLMGGGDHVFQKDEWLEILKLLDRKILATMISIFNEHELSVMSN